MIVYYPNTVSGIFACFIHEIHSASRGLMGRVKYRVGDPRMDLDLENKSITFFDFCPSRKVLRKLLTNGCDLQVYDYHACAYTKCKYLPIVSHLDKDKCGARLFYECHNTEPAGWAFDYIEDILFYRYKLPGSKQFDAYLRYEQVQPKDWFEVIHTPAWKMMKAGDKYFEAERVIVRDIIESATDDIILGHKAKRVTCPFRPWDIARELSLHTDIGACTYLDNGIYITHMVTQCEDIDLVKILRPYGAGGSKKRATIKETMFRYV